MWRPTKPKNRHRLKWKEAQAIASDMETAFGMTPFGPDVEVDRASAGELDVLIIGKDIVGVVVLASGAVYPTVRGLIAMKGTKRNVDVDKGAIPYITNGADVMAPGITGADPSIAEGMVVWIRDEERGIPLAIGTALMTGPQMATAETGKAVKTLHHVGDELWNLTV